jgi:hypothetical protein
MGYGLWVMGYGLWVMGYACCVSPATCKTCHLQPLYIYGLRGLINHYAPPRNPLPGGERGCKDGGYVILTYKSRYVILTYKSTSIILMLVKRLKAVSTFGQEAFPTTSLRNMRNLLPPPPDRGSVPRNMRNLRNMPPCPPKNSKTRTKTRDTSIPIHSYTCTNTYTYIHIIFYILLMLCLALLSLPPLS